MRRAFTIIELLVSIGIFAISSALMFGALFGATEVFRRGEAARQAGDEATAVIAALQEDLSRVVPIRLRDGEPAKEWGRIEARNDSTGNCSVSLVIENPDRSQVRWITLPAPNANQRVLVGMRKRVVWYVEPATTPDATPADAFLVREEWDMTEDGTIVDKLGVALTAASQDPLRLDIVTRGCLHFGVWLEMAEAHRVVTAGTDGPDFRWESIDANETVIPFKGRPFDTGVKITEPGYAPFYAQPDAIRVSLVLTGGGRFATRGTLVQDNGTDVRISGIKALPTVYGSLLRIDNEWVHYENFRNGLVTISASGRGALRSTTSTHNGRPTVFAGQPFSLVVALPR